VRRGHRGTLRNGGNQASVGQIGCAGRSMAAAPQMAGWFRKKINATGDFTLHGVTKPLTLDIDSFKCMTYPQDKKEHCGANATGTFNRADFGISYGEKYGFKMDVKLAIQVEGVRVG